MADSSLSTHEPQKLLLLEFVDKVDKRYGEDYNLLKEYYDGSSKGRVYFTLGGG